MLIRSVTCLRKMVKKEGYYGYCSIIAVYMSSLNAAAYNPNPSGKVRPMLQLKRHG